MTVCSVKFGDHRELQALGSRHRSRLAAVRSKYRRARVHDHQAQPARKPSEAQTPTIPLIHRREPDAVGSRRCNIRERRELRRFGSRQSFPTLIEPESACWRARSSIRSRRTGCSTRVRRVAVPETCFRRGFSVSTSWPPCVHPQSQNRLSFFHRPSSMDQDLVSRVRPCLNHTTWLTFRSLSIDSGQSQSSSSSSSTTSTNDATPPD